MANGYMGKILEVNLTTGAINTIETDVDMARKFMGGQGFGIKMLWDRVRDPAIDPLGPDNIFMLMVGPITGTPIPGASRFTTYCKSPIAKPLDPAHPNAGSIAVATCGGWFAPEVKHAGYDGIMVLGKAAKPVYLYIDDDKVEIRDASHLWGKGTDETDMLLREELGPEFRFVMVGPAGENAQPLACVVTESSRAAGRGGTGGVMGSKNLKAIACRGSKTVPLADAKGVYELRRHVLEKVLDWPGIDMWRRTGTAGINSANSDAGLWACRNHREGTWTEGWQLWAPYVERTFWQRHRSCSQCPMHCMKIGVIKSGPYKGTIAEGPEYEHSAMLGADLLMTDLYGTMRLIYECDNLGLDAIGAGGAIAFAMECYEHGLLTASDLGGVEAVWGDAEAAIALARMIAYGEGFGAYLAQGTRVAAEQIGPEALRFSMECKNHAYPAHGVQNNPNRGVFYATSNRGACHLTGHNKASQNEYAIRNSLVCCTFVHSSAGGMDFYPAVVNAITGWNMGTTEYLEIGDRIWNLERAYMGIQGFRRQDDYLRDRVFEPLQWGPHAGAHRVREEEEAKKDTLYTERGWDVAKALPTPETLRKLGLDEAAEEIARLN